MTYTGKITLTEAAHLSYKGSDFIAFSRVFQQKLMEKMIEIMEDDDDVQNVWHNWDQE